MASRIQVSGSVSITFGGVPRVCTGPGRHCTAAAGGIRTSKNAIQYLVQVHETLGPDWLTPDLYRIGASSLVNDILMQLRKEKTGAYQSKDYFTND